MSVSSPEAKAMRLKDREFRDAQHVETVQKEGERKSKEPLKGNQPWPKKSRPQ